MFMLSALGFGWSYEHDVNEAGLTSKLIVSPRETAGMRAEMVCWSHVRVVGVVVVVVGDPPPPVAGDLSLHVGDPPSFVFLFHFTKHCPVVLPVEQNQESLPLSKNTRN